jgi:hypothetical protein
MAGKLARLVYMLRYGMNYVEQGAKFYEAQYRVRQIGQLKWKPPLWHFALLKLQPETPDFLRMGVSGETSGQGR